MTTRSATAHCKLSSAKAAYHGESKLFKEVRYMYAIIKTGGKQVKVEEGQTIYVEKLDVEAGEKVTFDQVVFVGGDQVKVGTPLVDGASVEATVEKHGRQKKVTTFKYIKKKDSRRKQGHRQPYTKLTINSINA